MANSTKLRKRAEQLKGRPVCITLHDGRSYVGWITGLEKEAVVLSRTSARQRPRRKSSSTSRKAEVSGVMPLLGSFMGGAGGGLGGGLGGIMGMFGMMQKAMPVMKMGYNMIKSIRPFLGGLKGLMG
jgi:hypothetical protein